MNKDDNFLFSICINEHNGIAYLSHGGVAGTDMMWSIPAPCSQSTDITSPTLTSQMFIDALLASHHRNVTLFWLSQIPVLNSSIQFLIICNPRIHVWNTIVHLTGRMGLAVHWPLVSKTISVYEMGKTRHHVGYLSFLAFAALCLCWSFRQNTVLYRFLFIFYS